MIRLFADDSKRPVAERIAAALAQAPRPVSIGIPQGCPDAPSDVDGVPVGVSTSGLVLHATWFEFVYGEGA